VKLVQTHKLADGVTKVKHYGLLAAAEVMPIDIVVKALAKAKRFESVYGKKANKLAPEELKRRRRTRINHDYVFESKRILVTQELFGRTVLETSEMLEAVERRRFEGLEALENGDLGEPDTGDVEDDLEEQHFMAMQAAHDAADYDASYWDNEKPDEFDLDEDFNVDLDEFTDDI
jgi:hypothetical protein